MKKKPEQCTRQGKSNNNIKNFLSNLKENDLHFDDNQISQCVFLGVLRLKPVPSVFTNNKVPSQVVESKPKRFRNNNSTKEVNKNISSKKDINKVISGKIRKKNPDTIKASVKKLASKKSVIKLKFDMNKHKKGSVSIAPDSLTKISSQDLFQNRTIALNPIQTAPSFNPVQNLFDKLKQQMDEKYNRPSSSEISKEILFSSEVNLDPTKSSRKPKKSPKKKPIFERLVMPLLPSNSSLSDNGYYSSSGSMNTHLAKNDVIVINEESCSDAEEVLVNSGFMPNFVETPPEKNQNNDVILIEDNPKCGTPNRDLIVIDDSKSTRTSPRLNKQEQKISSNNNQEKTIDSNVINLEENSESTVSSKNSSEKPRKRRTLLPTIPLNFFNTPMLLRSELAQKKGGEGRSSMRASSNKAQKSEKQEKPQVKQRKDKPESKSRNSTENLIYEVVKSSTAIPDHITAENSGSQDDVILVENSPPKVEPLIIKLKVFQNKSTNEQTQENKSQKPETAKVTKNLFFPRLLRSDINQAKPINEEKLTKSSETLAKASRKELLQTEFNQNGPEKTVMNETAISSNTKTEKSPDSPRRQLRSDFAQEKNNNDDGHEKTETVAKTNSNIPIEETALEKSPIQRQSRTQKKLMDSTEVVETQKNSEKSESSEIIIIDQTKPRQLRSGVTQTRSEIIVVDETEPNQEEVMSESATARLLRSNQAQKKPTDSEIVVVDKNSPIRDRSPKKDFSEQTTKPNQAQKKPVVSEVCDLTKNQEKSPKNDSTTQPTQKFTQAQKKSGSSEIVENSIISPNQEKLGKKQKAQKQEIKLESEVITIQSPKEIEDNQAQKKSVDSQVNKNLPVATEEKITDQFSKSTRFNQDQKAIQEIIDPNVITVAQFYSPKEKTKAKEKAKSETIQKKSAQEKIKDDTNNNQSKSLLSDSKPVARRSLRSDVAQKELETKEAPEKPKRDRSKSKTLEERQLRSEGAQKATDSDLTQKPAANEVDNSKKSAPKSKNVARRHLRSELSQKDELKNDTSKNVKNFSRYGDLGIDLLDYADLSFDTATPRKLRSVLAQQSANEADPNKTEGKSKEVEQPQLKRLRSELVQENLSDSEIKTDVIDLDINNTVKLESSENEKSISEPKIAKRNVSKTRTSKISDFANVKKSATNRSRSKSKSKPEKIESVTVLDSNSKISETENTTIASVTKKLQKVKKLVKQTKKTPNFKNKTQSKSKKDSKKKEKEPTKEEVTVKVEENTEQDVDIILHSDNKLSKKRAGAQKNDKINNVNEKNKKPKKTIKGGKRIRLFGKITKRSNRIQPITNSKKSPKRAEKPQEAQKKTLRPRSIDIQSTEASKTRNKSPNKKRQVDFDEITVVTEKRTKKPKELPLRTLRSSFIPVVVKEEPADKPVAVVEKVVALIHSEPKPKNLEESTQKKSKVFKNKEKVKAGVRSAQKINEIENLEEIKEATPSRGTKKRESKEAVPSKQLKKKNANPKKSGVSQKSKVIAKNKKVEVVKKLRSNTKSTVSKKEKVLTQKKTAVKSNIQKLTQTSKKVVLEQVKSKLKSSKTPNPQKKPEAKKKPGTRQKGAMSWQNNALIERIIEELKNSIFIPGNKMKKDQHKLKKQGLNKELVSKKNAIFKKKYVIKSAEAKKKLLLAKKKLLQRKIELQKKLRNAKNAVESEENNPPEDTYEIIEESQQKKETVKEETTVHLVNSYLEEVIIEDDVFKSQSNSMEEFKEVETSNDKPGNIVIINDIMVQSNTDVAEKIAKRKGQEILEATKRKRTFEDTGEEARKIPILTSVYQENDKYQEAKHFSIFNKNSCNSVVPKKTIDLNDNNLNRMKDISVFDFDESEPEVGPLRHFNTYNENILITSNENTKDASTGLKTTETQTTPVKQITHPRIENVAHCKTDDEETHLPLRSVSAQTDTDVVFVKENAVEIEKEPPILSQFSPPEKPKRERSVIIEELLKELNATTDHEEIDRSHVIEDLLRELNENNPQETFSEMILPNQYKREGRSKIVSPLDEEGKPRKLWSVIENPEPDIISPPRRRTFSYSKTSANSTITSNDRHSSSVFNSERPSTLGLSGLKEPSDGGDKKSPLKQATIIEMFSKVWMKQDKPTVVRNLGKGDKMFTSMPPPPPPMSIPTGYTIVEPKPRPSETFTAPSPRRDRFEEDDSDTESRVEWVPEEYAEYRFKYSAQKMMQKYKPIYRCKVCQLQFPSYYKLIKHRKEHEDKDRPYVCPQCGSQYKDVVDFSAHLRVHKGKHPYMCLKCDMGFWTKKAYEAHIPVHILKKTKQPVKKFRCDICAKEFSKLCDVERHTRVHTGEKPCVCNICNKRFQQAHNLSKHLLTHLHIKPFECEICNKQFGRNDVLRRHLLTHSIDKPIKCSICERGFIRHSQLLQHMRKKHPDVPIDQLTEPYLGMSEGEEEDEVQDDDLVEVVHVKKETSVGPV